MTITCIFSNAYNINFSDDKNIINYTCYYQIVYKKILGLIGESLTSISIKTIKLILQKKNFSYLSKDYLVLVTIIKTKWKEKITSFFDTILKVIRYAKINKKNEKDMASNASINTFAVET